MNLNKLLETVKDKGADMLQSMVSQKGGHGLVPEQQQPRNTDYNLKCMYRVYPSILYKLGNIPKV